MDRQCVASRMWLNGGGWSCASVSGPCMERLCSWPSWISARTRSHSRKGPERPLGSPDHGCDGRDRFSISSIQLADLGGINLIYKHCTGGVSAAVDTLRSSEDRRASAIAWASLKSFLWPCRNGLA